MINEGDIKKFLKADYFLFQKIQNHTWETVKKSGSLEEVKKEFALNYRIELNGKFRIAHYSFDNSHQRWVYKVVLLVNTKYLNQSFIEIISVLSFIKSTWPVQIRLQHDQINEQTVKK